MSPLVTRTTGLFTFLVVLSSTSSVQEPPTLIEAPSIRSVTSNSLSITWSAWDGESDGGDGPVIGYKVYHRMQGEEDFTLSFPDLIPDTSATISNLTRDTEYEIAVAPVRPGSGGEGSLSPYLHTRTYCEAPSEEPVLAFPEIGLTSITLSWQLPAEETWGCRPGSTSEIGILYGTEGNTKTVISFPTSAETGTLSSLSECTIYEITGFISNKDQLFGPFPAATSVRTALIIPEAVSNFQYSPSSTQHAQIFFTWSVSITSCPPDYYMIRYSLLQKRACPSPEPNVIQHETITNTTNNEFDLVGLEAYSTYSIAFVAVNDAGEGEAVERTVFTQHGTPPAVTGLRVDTSITNPTSMGFIWDALTCRNIRGEFGYYYARLYEQGITSTQGSTARGSPSVRKYIDYIDQSSVLFDDLQPCTIYELLLTTTINTAPPGATHPAYVSGDHSRASGLTGLTLTNVRVEASSTRDSSMVVRWSVPAPCSVSYYSLEYQLIEYLACPGDPIPEAPVSTLNVTGSYNILSGLEPFSSYRVSITGIINGARNTPVVGIGPSSESAPSALSSVSYTAETNTLHFTWDALPCEDLHGELHVYEYNLYNTLTRSYVGSSRETTRATRLSINGLNACSDYRFQVRVVLLSGHRSDWTTLMARTNISAPDQPQINDLEPHRDEAGTTGLTVSWSAPNANSNLCQPTAYEIKYRLLQLDMCEDASEAPNERAGVVPGSTLTFDLSNFLPYSEYSVFVRGSTSAGYGPEDVMQQSTGYATPTGVPTNIQAFTVNRRSLTFTWEEPPCGQRHGPITGYDLVLYDATSDAEVERSNVSSTSALEASFQDLVPYYDYSVIIRARNYELLGPYSPRVTQQTSEAKQPAAPIRVTIPSSDVEGLTIEWQSPNPPEAHIIGYYIVYWETMLQDADSGDRMNVSIPCTSSLCRDIDERLSHTITGLSSETNYSIQVHAESRVGISPPSSPTVTEITREGPASTDSPVQEFVNNLKKENVTLDTVEHLSSGLANVTKETDQINEEVLESVSGILNGIVDLTADSAQNLTDDQLEEVTQKVFETVDNVLELPGEEFSDNEDVSSSLLASLETITTAVQENVKDNVTYSGENLKVAAVKVEPKKFPIVAGVTNAEGSGFAFESNKDSPSPESSATNVVSVSLPKAILDFLPDDEKEGEPVSISLILVDAKLFQSNESSSAGNGARTDELVKVVASPVLYLTFEGANVSGLLPNNSIEFLFQINQTLIGKGDLTCRYWSPDSSGGEWLRDGCTTVSVSDAGTVECSCNHLTSFAVLLDTYGGINSRALDIISRIGCVASAICLTITLCFMLGIRNLRRKEPQQILINLSLALLGLYLTFLGVDRLSPQGGCYTVALLLHFFCLSAMAWMSVEAFSMYLMFVKVMNTYRHRMLLKCSLVGWGIPAGVVVVTVAANWRAYLNPKYCFIIPGASLNYGVVLPIGVLLVFNAVIFGLVTYKLTCGRRNVYKHSTSGDDSARMRVEMTRRAQNAVAIGTLLGLTWVFGFMAFGEARLLLHVLFAVFNSLQGVFIFLMFGIRQPEVRDKLSWMKKRCVEGGSAGRRRSSGLEFTSSTGTTRSPSHLTTESALPGPSVCSESAL